MIKYFLVVLCMFSGSVLAADSAWKARVSSGLFYSSGQSQTTGSADSTMYSVPLMISLASDRMHANLSTSYMDISSKYPTTGNVSKVSGMGDVTLSLGYDLTESPTWTLTYKHKFAVANVKKGLSTGKDDNYLQLDYFSTLGQRTSVFGTAGYKFVGKVSGSNMKDSAYGSLGMGYFFPSKTSVGVSADYTESTYKALKDQTGASVFLGQSLSKVWSTALFASYDNTSTTSAGLTFTRKF